MNNDIREVLESLHKPHRYLADGIKPTGLNDFLEVAIDVTAGIETSLDLISSRELARDCGETPLIGASESVNLLRFAMVASRLLRNEALQHVEWLNDHALKKGSGS
jgi:hypothetical protein